MVMRRIANWLTADPRAQRTMLEQRSALGGGRVVEWTVGRPQWPARTIDTYDQSAYRKVGLIFRSVQYLANAAGSAPLRVYRRVEGEDEPLDDHPLRALLSRPNPLMGEQRFLSFVTMNMTVSGFCVIEKERDQLGNVIGLWPLRSDWLRAVPRQQDAPDWEYRVPGYQEPFRLLSEDVIAIPYADTPDFAPIGIGPLEVLLREIGVTSTMTEFLKTFMDRGAMPLYVLVPSDDPTVANQWKDQATKDAFMGAWRSRYGGLHNAVEPMPLVGIKDIKPLGFDFNQLAYPELNNLTDARICTGFGIPPILLGAQVGLEQATYSNYGQARTSFYEDTMGPLWARLDDAFTRHLLPEFATSPDEDVAFDLSDIPALQDDENEKHARAVAAFSSAMVSRHAAQRAAGYEPHGPDVFLVPFNMIEQGADTTATNGQRATVEIAEEIFGALAAEAELRKLESSIKELTAALDPEPRIVTRDGRRYLNERVQTPAERESRARIVSTHRDAILRLADVAAPAVAAYLSGQRDRIVSAIAGERSQPSPNGHGPAVMEIRAVESIDWDDEANELLRALEQWLETLGAESFALAATELGTADVWNVSNAYLRELRDLLGQRIVGITETTRRDVERVVLDALTEGTSMPDLAGKLRGLYDEVYQNRSMTIARTESQVAFSHASMMSYEASGVVSEVLIHDNPACKEPIGGDGLSCSGRNGMVVAVSQMMRHSSGTHPNCIIAFSPIVAPLGDA